MTSPPELDTADREVADADPAEATTPPATGPGLDRPPLLELRDVSMDFQISRGWFGTRGRMKVRAVRDVSLTIGQGETVGLVGESGSGKTTLGRCILRAHRPSAGSIIYHTADGDQVDLVQSDANELRRHRRDIRMIFQDPNSSLNPRLTVSQIIAEPLINLKQGLDSKLARGELQDRVIETMRLVGLRPDQAERYPHAFSGGERQRVGIARALITNPRLVVCDEAVTALDVSIRSQVLNLLQELQERLGLTYLFISHDLAVIKHLCDRVAVMYVGELVEQAPAEELFRRPRHPYTEALLASLPVPDPYRRRDDRPGISGEIPDPAEQIPGCVFHPRCPHAQDRCATDVPGHHQTGPDTVSRCHFAEDLNLLGIGRRPGGSSR
ncbi:ABC transporter ATP-binding protein [Microlunatus speluncae]|uniref:ABC transporter ATP-binding protein n=1 Tax=Microlunatus speluncae TaxID=2594267 RepID=UPI0012665E48|nr:ABC transporter ATP-binding protein [Microlunatus speluncae]